MADQPHVIVQMEHTIRRWQASADRRSTFLKCYLLMTRNMLIGLETGEFHDPDWVERLLNRFAEYYFQALREYRSRDQRAPSVWRRAHIIAVGGEAQVLQDLLLGVNAHINYDLVLALVDVLEPEREQLTEEKLRQRYADHCRVNVIIGRTIDSVQDEVIEVLEPEMDVLDKLLGRLDEWMISSLITRWRDEVWGHALEMLWLETPGERERKRREIEARTLDRAHGIMLEP